MQNGRPPRVNLKQLMRHSTKLQESLLRYRDYRICEKLEEKHKRELKKAKHPNDLLDFDDDFPLIQIGGEAGGAVNRKELLSDFDLSEDYERMN